MSLTADEIERIACHEVGHALEGRYVGRTLRRIEWIVDGHGSRAQAVFEGSTEVESDVSHLLVAADVSVELRTVLEDLVERRNRALMARLRICVGGVVGEATCAGRPSDPADLHRADCEDDRFGAATTARLLLGSDASEQQVEALIANAMKDVQADARGGERRHHAERIERRLIQLRTEQPNGLVVLDSRELDELLGDVPAGWEVATS